MPSLQWLNYSKVGGVTLNSGVNVELVPVVKFSWNGLERQLKEGHILSVQSNQFCAVQKAECAVQDIEMCSPDSTSC